LDAYHECSQKHSTISQIWTQRVHRWQVVYCQFESNLMCNSMYVFGGTSKDTSLGDLVSFDFGLTHGACV
jgi:hypothetical protein